MAHALESVMIGPVTVNEGWGKVISAGTTVIQPIYVNNGTYKTYKADFFTNTLDMIP